VLELDHILKALTPLIGLRLQEVQTGPEDLVLGFYSSEGLLWLWIDLDPLRPSLLPWGHLPRKPLNKKTPLQLFLRAHFLGRVLRTIERSTAHGRVVTLSFGGVEDELEIEVRLFPHGRNVLVRHGKKSLAWQKPKELAAESAAVVPHEQVRTLDQLRDEWMRRRGTTSPKSSQKQAADPKVAKQRELEKKRHAVEKVQAELKKKTESPWRAVGNWIKEHQSLQVAAEWEPFVDRRRKLAWNIEQCFSKAREIEGKVEGTRTRLRKLQEEIERLERQPEGAAAVSPTKRLPDLQIQADRRTLKISEQVHAVMGKSARDNLQILRKARAWDLWMHLKDYPSSHAVIFRNKGDNVGDAVLFEVANWFVRTQMGEKASRHKGEKFELVLAECRHVNPIKGDKIGRVTYRDERLLIFQFSG